MSDNTIILKKIYINDYFINTKLLNQTINKILLNHLSKNYKTKNINHKIKNILNKIDNLYKEDYNNNKIFNLSYQPYNQYNIIYNYLKKNFNKKWIIPVVEQQKNLFINSFSYQKKYNKFVNIYMPNSDNINNINNTISYIDNTNNQNITFPTHNLFIDYNKIEDSLYSKTRLKEAPWKNNEVEVLNNYPIYNNNQNLEISASKTNTHIIRKSFNDEKIYYLSESKTQTTSEIDEYNKVIQETLYDLSTILQNENINITHFCILNPVKLFNTNYNIFLGNCMSYINEIINTTHLFINDILDSQDSDYYKYTNNNDFFTEYKNIEDNFILNYLNIIKTYKNFDNIYSIRAIKYIYNMFGYDLNKIPNCYIKYLSNILDNNIRTYILDNILDNKQFISQYKKYIQQQIITNKNNNALIKNLYDIEIDNDLFDTNLQETLYSTFDNGLYYYSHKYYEYINSLKPKKLKINNYTSDTVSTCSNYNVVKYFDSIEIYNYLSSFSPLNYIDVNFSKNVYLILYEDIIKNIYLPPSQYKFNTIFIADIVDFQPKISSIKQITLQPSILNELLNDKNLIYSSLYKNIEYDILFNRLSHYKYKSQYYVLLPTQKIISSDLIQIKESFYTFNKSINKLEPFIFPDSDCIYNKSTNTFINNKSIQKNIIKKQQEHEIKHYNNLNKINYDLYKKTVNNKLIIHKNNQIFNKLIINKSQIEKPYTLEISDLQPISYQFYLSQNTKNQLIKYLLEYNPNSIKSKKYDQNGLYNIILNSKFNTKYTNTIRQLGNKIKDNRYQSSISKYINDFEFIDFIADTNNKYNRAYYKISEILLNNPIIKKTNIKYLALAEAPGNFVRYIRNFIQNNNSNWNNFDILTLLTHEELISQQNFIQEFQENIFKPNDDYTGDLTKSENIDLYLQNSTSKADLITADGGINKKDDIDYKLEELLHLPLFLGETISAILNQATDGVFIMKIFNIIDINTINIIYLLSTFYEDVNVIKPFTSRPHNSEKYLICSGFKAISDSNFEIIKKNLYSMLDNINLLSSNTYPTYSKDDVPYFNIFENFNYDEAFNKSFIDFNKHIITKTQYFYLQTISDIINTKAHYSYVLIDKYFSKNSNANISALLEQNTIEIGFFINKIYSSIKLCNYIGIPIKNNYFYLIESIKKQKKCILDNNCNLYPPHFKIKYDIDNDIDTNTTTSKIKDFVQKYCIFFDINNINPILHHKVNRITENFTNNQNIKKINHSIINKIKENKDDIEKLYYILLEICKVSDIHKLFHLYSDKIISIIIKFQNNIRNILGFYLCKYTYIPLYPKYKTIEDPIQQKELYGILYNSHYICYFSGDKLDIEEFDEFMGSSLYRSTNLSIFEDDNSINSILLDSLNLQWNPEIQNIEHNISLFIMNEFQSLYTSFDLTSTIKYNIIKNYSNFNNYNLKNIITSDNLVVKFISKIFDIIYLKRIETKKYLETDPKKYNKLNHPANTFLKSKNLSEIYKLKQSNKTISQIYDSFYSTHLDKYVTKTQETTKINGVEIPSFKAKKQNSKEINTEIVDYLKDLYVTFLIQEFIIKEFNNIIQYTISILFFNFYDKKIELMQSNIKNIQIFFTKIINKLINKIYTTNTLYFDNLISKLTQPYNDTVKIDSINSNIFNLNKILEKHLDNKWNLLYKNNLPKFDELYKDQKNPIIKILFDDNIIKSSNTIIISTIKYFNKSKSKQAILNKFLKLDYTLFFINENISSNLFSIFNNFTNIPLFNDNISIINTIDYDKPEFKNLNILQKKNQNYKLTFTPFTNTFSTHKQSEISIFNQYFQHLLIYVYESQDIDSNDITNFYNKKRLYYLKDDNLEYCYYTNYSKHHIINNILALDNDTIVSIYNKSLQSKKYILNHTNYINQNKLDDETFIGLNSLFHNLNYKLKSKNINLIYKFINLFIKNYNFESKSPLWNIQMKFYSDPVHYTKVFLESYKKDFIDFINQTDTDYQNDIMQIIDSLLPVDYFIQELQEIYIKYNFDSKDKILSKLNIVISEKQNSISNYIPHFDLISSNNISSNSLILFINSIIKNISYISNIFIDSQTSSIHILKNKFSNIKKYYKSDYDFKLLLKTVQNNLFDFTQFLTDDNTIYLQIVFSEILNDLSFQFNSLYCTDTELSQKLIYYKILKLLEDSFNKLSSDYVFSKQQNFNKKYQWNYVENSIVSISSYTNIDSITTLDNKYNNQIYLDLFTKIVIYSMNDIYIFSNNINDLNINTNVDFYNEDDLYNNGGSEYENIPTFDDDMYLDDVDDHDEDHYYD